MIDYVTLEINTIDDYDKLNGLIENPLYINDFVIEQLQDRIGLRCKLLVIESMYRDFDFSSIYSSFYSKKHRPIPKECYRIHFFTSNDLELPTDHYAGFMVLRPSIIGDSRGRAHLKPELLIDTNYSYVMLAPTKSHILGQRYQFDAFPWMAQETDISRCAHSAAWSIIRYFSDKYHHYKQRSINDIVEMTPLLLNRKTPSEGLTLVQLSEIFAAAGFHPLILRRGKSPESKERFESSIFAYIESGIPIVAAMSGKEHAISVIGHGAINQEKIDNYAASSLTLSNHFIDSLIAIDDNHLPYKVISRAPETGTYGLESIDYALIPLYEKMFLSADIVLKLAKLLLQSKRLNVPGNAILRPYITSARSLKHKSRINASLNDDLKDIILKIPMPQFVWCVDISTIDEYRNHKTSARIIVDVTAASEDDNPWILTHDSKLVSYYDCDEGWMEEDIDIEPYDIYKNNLSEVIL